MELIASLQSYFIDYGGKSPKRVRKKVRRIHKRCFSCFRCRIINKKQKKNEKIEQNNFIGDRLFCLKFKRVRVVNYPKMWCNFCYTDNTVQ